MNNRDIVDARRLYSRAAIREFTLEKIQEAKPSEGWSLGDIQDQAAKEFPHRARKRPGEMSTVEYEVKKAVFAHCNITSHLIPQNAENVRNSIKSGIIWKINGEEWFFNDL